MVDHNKGYLYSHEAAEHLLGIIIDPSIGKADTGTVKGHPCTPL